MSGPRPFFPLAVVLAALMLLGADCTEELAPIEPGEVDRSDVPAQQEGAVWTSDPWSSQDPEFRGLIEIEPTASIKLYHGLGRTPVEVHAYVGFEPDSERLMPLSGNGAELYDVNDEYIVIQNGSGGSFFYRFVLR